MVEQVGNTSELSRSFRSTVQQNGHSIADGSRIITAKKIHREQKPEVVMISLALMLHRRAAS
jgi:hypothetical protein